MRVILYSLVAVAAPLIFSGPAHAQAAGEEVRIFDNPAFDKTLFEFSYATPNSPVLPLIGVESGQIARVDSIRKFGVNFLGGVGSTKAGPAFSIDLNPFWLLSKPVSLESYYGASALKRVVARTALGFAASQGDKAVARPSSLVLSVSTKLLDGQDRLKDDGFKACLENSTISKTFKEMHDRVAADLVNIPSPQAAADFLDQEKAKIAQREKDSFAAIDKTHAQCVVQQSKRLSVRPSFDAGFGLRFNGQPGRFRNFDNSGAIVWATFATGLLTGGREKLDGAPGSPVSKVRVRAVLHGRYTLNEAVLSDKFVLQGKRNASMLVAGIESAPSADPTATEKLRWNIQAGWNRQNAVLPTDVDKNFLRYQAIANIRIANGLWLNGTLGRVSGDGVKTDTKALLGFTFTPPSGASKIAEYYGGSP